MKKFILALHLLGAFCLCSIYPASGYGIDKMPVFVSILPQKYFVEQIAGNLVDVSVMVQPGSSPATYEPKPKQMAGISSAEIYFAVGVPFEAVWLPKIAFANPDMHIVYTDEGITKMPMKSLHHHGTGENHGELQPEHVGGNKDPHIWTSPELVKIIARNIRDALIKADSANKDIYNENFNRFLSKINQMNMAFRKLFSTDFPNSAFMVFHPSWGYFARSYGLEQIPVELEGKDPKPAQLQRLIKTARKKRIKVIFVQPQFSTQSAEVIAKAIGGRVVLADPLAYDWAENLKQQAEAFKDALK